MEGLSGEMLVWGYLPRFDDLMNWLELENYASQIQ